MVNPRLSLISAVFAVLPAIASAGEIQSKLAGSWKLVEGVKEFAGEQQPLTFDGPAYLVIRPDGSFYKVGHFANAALDRIKNAGDTFVTEKNIRVEVLESSYEPDASELRLSIREGESGDLYEFGFDAKLQPDGQVILKTTTPMIGHVSQTITATLERLDREPLWQPEGMIAEWSLDGNSLSVDISADGKRIVAADLQSGIVSLWNTDTPDEPAREFAGHENDICAVAISPDGRFIASGSRRDSRRGSEKYSLRIWNADNGKELHRIDAFQTVTSIDFSPDSKSIFASGIPSNYSVDKKVSAGRWNVETGELETAIYNDHGFLDAVLSPTGERILVRPVINRHNVRLLLLDPTTGDEMLRLGSRVQPIQDVTFSTDGSRIVTASEDTFLCEWQVATGEEIRRFKVDPLWASEVVYLPSGRQILTANENDNSICVWDAETGKLVKKFAGHRRGIFDLKVSANGNIAVSTSSDGTVRAWRLSPA